MRKIVSARPRRDTVFQNAVKPRRESGCAAGSGSAVGWRKGSGAGPSAGSFTIKMITFTPGNRQLNNRLSHGTARLAAAAWAAEMGSDWPFKTAIAACPSGA